MTDYIYSGVRASDEQEREMRSAMATPWIAPGGNMPQPPEKTIHRIAIACGLPEIVGHYGYDFARHEFISLPEPTIAEPVPGPAGMILRVLGMPETRAKFNGNSFTDSVEIGFDSNGRAEELFKAICAYQQSLVTEADLQVAIDLQSRLKELETELHAKTRAFPYHLRQVVTEGRFRE